MSPMWSCPLSRGSGLLAEDRDLGVSAEGVRLLWRQCISFGAIDCSRYRIRCDRSEFKIPQRGDIFHVPFEKRRLVGNQRYSIAGLPCLYLGSSIWICWEELGRPPLDSVWVSRFRIVKQASVLDFQFPPHHVWRLFEFLRLSSANSLDRTDLLP